MCRRHRGRSETRHAQTSTSRRPASRQVPRRPKVAAPNVVGLPVDEATAKLDAVGLDSRQTDVTSTEPARTVVDQVPIIGAYKHREIEYVDRAPKKVEVQIPLVEYFERVKRVKADAWQVDFCRRLEDAWAS